ncbi:MAG: hypothetical protein K0U41_06390 [Gammaproteobacteria bacterium]|nr:hypothetical protein [Gammaproteobacteria bacterium]
MSTNIQLAVPCTFSLVGPDILIKATLPDGSVWEFQRNIPTSLLYSTHEKITQINESIS